MNQKGFSLAESLLVVVVIGSIVFLLANVPNAMMLYTKAKHMSLAREIAIRQIEDKRTISYANLVNDNIPIADSRLSLLSGGSGYVLVEDCDLSVCQNGEALKQVTAVVSWNELNKPQAVTIKTMIGEGGINQ